MAVVTERRPSPRSTEDEAEEHNPRALAAVTLGVAAALAVPPAPASAAARFTPGAPGAGDPYFPDMGNGGYDVAHYDIDLKYDPGTRGVGAAAKITARATQNLSRFDLDFLGPFTISSLKVDGTQGVLQADRGAGARHHPAQGLRKGRELHGRRRLLRRPAAHQRPGAGHVRLDRDARRRGRAVNQPFGAATWLPGQRHPTDKATYTSPSRCRTDLQTLSNGDLRRHVDAERATPRPAGSSGSRRRASSSCWRSASTTSSHGRTSTGVRNITAIDRAMNTGPTTRGSSTGDRRVIDFEPSVYGRYPFSSTGGIDVRAGSATPWRPRPARCTPAARPAPPARRSARPRARPPVVRRLGHAERLAAHLAERGLRDVHRVALQRAARGEPARRASTRRTATADDELGGRWPTRAATTSSTTSSTRGRR